MAKFRNINWKSKKTWKNILVIGLAVITLIGAIVGLTALFRKSEETTKEISPSWAIGGLTETGAYLKTKESIYTKDAFECKGLNVKIDFDNNVSYRIFFYDYDDNFVSSTSKLTANYNEDIDVLVKSARIVITPNDDSKISWYEKNSYAKQLTISVDKEQPGLALNFNRIRLGDETTFTLDSGCYYNANGRNELADYNSYVFVATGSCCFYLDTTSEIENFMYVVTKNGVPVRYKIDQEGYVCGSDNVFDLSAGDKVVISILAKYDINIVSFYLGEYVLK